MELRTICSLNVLIGHMQASSGLPLMRKCGVQGLCRSCFAGMIRSFLSLEKDSASKPRSASTRKRPCDVGQYAFESTDWRTSYAALFKLHADHESNGRLRRSKFACRADCGKSTVILGLRHYRDRRMGPWSGFKNALDSIGSSPA